MRSLYISPNVCRPPISFMSQRETPISPIFVRIIWVLFHKGTNAFIILRFAWYSNNEISIVSHNLALATCYAEIALKLMAEHLTHLVSHIPTIIHECGSFKLIPLEVGWFWELAIQTINLTSTRSDYILLYPSERLQAATCNGFVNHRAPIFGICTMFGSKVDSAQCLVQRHQWIHQPKHSKSYQWLVSAFVSVQFFARLNTLRILSTLLSHVCHKKESIR